MYKTFHYFLSYSFSLAASGFGYGNIEISRTDKIRNMNDISSISRMIEEKNNLPENSVIILDYQLFD